ncbi:MAG: hypothetical protein KME45_28225 [Stenomitos rutilans HA7619-LM2]|jgi:aryl-alcohol dehydrogenase-like predicted oxidoreductase|nr:hypothetical protein [Stenomitos rutilans HA7619-LM2]
MHKSYLEVSAIGLGCMSMSFSITLLPNRSEMISLIVQRLKEAWRFSATAEVYGSFVMKNW